MMKKIIIIQCLVVLVLCTSFTNKTNKAPSTCDISNFYKAIIPTDGTKVLNSYGNLEEAEVILVPTKLDIDVYKVRLTRKGSNLYKVEQTDLYVETKYCYEYATYEEAILKVTSSYGYTKGTLIFE